MKTLSIIIPTYGGPKDLVKLLKSIINQSLMPSSIYIIDDTPKNKIKKIVDKYYLDFKKLDVNLNYFRNSRNCSISTARNLGVEISEGEILLFLDSDIILYQNYIKKIVEPFMKYPNALGVQGWMINILNEGLKYQLVGKMFKLQEYSKNSCKYGEYPRILNKIIPCEYLYGSNMAIKRKVFEEGFKFDENLKGYSFLEDLLFSHSIYMKYPGYLYITPHAKCIHNSRNNLRKKTFKKINRKYALKKLFGGRGIILYYRQGMGLLVINIYKILFMRKDKNNYIAHTHARR